MYVCFYYEGTVNSVASVGQVYDTPLLFHRFAKNQFPVVLEHVLTQDSDVASFSATPCGAQV
jgi:hypothetical protein